MGVKITGFYTSKKLSNDTVIAVALPAWSDHIFMDLIESAKFSKRKEKAGSWCSGQSYSLLM